MISDYPVLYQGTVPGIIPGTVVLPGRYYGMINERHIINLNLNLLINSHFNHVNVNILQSCNHDIYHISYMIHDTHIIQYGTRYDSDTVS